MSTRRPRIKAVVTSLPIRRKNVDVQSKSSPQKAVPSESENSARPAESTDTPREPPALPTPPRVQTSVSRTPDIPRVEPQSVETTVTQETVAVDGIVPLAVPLSRTADLLKSEIISESAEVLFDPIVPLPSANKPRAKLRPAPRLPAASSAPALARRNSLHGSASESEEERCRGTSGRVRHDSHSSISTEVHTARESGRSRHDSSSSAAPTPAPTPATTTATAAATAAATTTVPSPTKDKHVLSKTGHGSRRGGGGTVVRRKQQRVRDGVQRDQLTMYDLIFFNPTTNPIVESESEKPVCSKLEKEETEAEEDGLGEEEAAPAPQIKIGPDGEVIVDEKSLVIKQTSESRRLSATVVQETEWARGGGGPGGRYSRAPRTRMWSDAETVRFYRALAALGTDFSLMAALFPDRTRRDLKMKFKKEERSNGVQIDKALSTRVEFAAEALATQFARERREAERAAREAERVAGEQRRAERERVQRARRQGFRLNKAGRAAVELMPAQRRSSGLASADDLIAYDAETKRKLASSAPVTAPSVPVPVPTTPRPRTYELPTDANPLALAANVAPGSLVCLTIADPHDPAKKVLQTYMANGEKLTPVTVPPHMLSHLMDYMTSNSASTTPPPPPASGAATTPADTKRRRNNSYTISSL